MENKKQKTIIFVFLALVVFFLPVGFVFSQGKPLEAEYPEVWGFKPETTETLVPDYVKYIFNLAIALAGLIALIVLIWAGTKYFTSAGDPGTLKSAKDQIKSAILGLFILFISYLILVTINPQLIIFSLPGIPKAPEPELPETPISLLITSDLLKRIEEMAEIIKKIPGEIKSTAGKIEELTNDCDCENTQSLCLCTGGSDSSECQPRRCYAGPPQHDNDFHPEADAGHHHPCPNFEEIKNNQQKIIVWKDEILYYKNRVLAEAEDLRDNIEEILNKKISWYEDKITAEEEVLGQIEEGQAKDLQQKLIDYLKEDRDWLIEEKRYKEELRQKLIELANAISKVEEPADKISQLPDECLVNVEEKCQASCKGECHDFKNGCQPDKCSGGNPCPTDEIQDQVGEISSLPGEINSLCNQIIAIINSIVEIQERKTEL